MSSLRCLVAASWELAAVIRMRPALLPAGPATAASRPWCRRDALAVPQLQWPRCGAPRPFSRCSHVAMAMAKPKLQYVCPDCGQVHFQDQSKCRGCGNWTKLVAEEQPRAAKAGAAPATNAYLAAIKGASSYASPGGVPLQSRPPAAAAAAGAGAERNTWVRQGSGQPRAVAQILRDDSYGPERVALTGQCGREISRVLGGGFVRGSLVLIAGEPGIGKSTLLMQLAALVAHPEMDHDTTHLRSYQAAAEVPPEEEAAATGGSEQEEREAAEVAAGGAPDAEEPLVLYVSGEEGEKQVADRADRLGLGACTRLLLMSATSLDDILRAIYALRPTAVIVDSIQTVYLERLDNSAGSPTQVRESTAMLKRVATETRAVIFIVGHVTKAGEVAGPKTVEHAVDTVLTLHGDTQSPYRLLRTTKNRYGSPSEVGIFSMERYGMRAVANPSEAFLSEREGHEPGVGCAVGCFIRGNRPIMLELQALVTARQQPSEGGSGPQGPGQRVFAGVDRTNAAKVVEILQKHARLNLAGASIFVNVVADQEITDVSGDLVIALALASSATGRAIPPDICAVGEIDLAGRLRQVREAQQVERLVTEAARMGFRRIILPAVSVKGKAQSLQEQFRGSIQLIPCKTLRQALYAALELSS